MSTPHLRSKHPVGQAMMQVAREQGWNVANPGEAEVARQLGLLGYTPADVETQFSLGPYRLDFAIPAEQIDIEADGWVHTARGARARDGRRDSQVRAWGWTIVRVDVDGDIQAQLCRHVPNRSRIEEYGRTLRQVDATFKVALDRLQRRGVADPDEQLDRMRAALRTAFSSIHVSPAAS